MLLDSIELRSNLYISSFEINLAPVFMIDGRLFEFIRKINSMLLLLLSLSLLLLLSTSWTQNNGTGVDAAEAPSCAFGSNVGTRHHSMRRRSGHCHARSSPHIPPHYCVDLFTGINFSVKYTFSLLERFVSADSCPLLNCLGRCPHLFVCVAVLWRDRFPGFPFTQKGCGFVGRCPAESNKFTAVFSQFTTLSCDGGSIGSHAGRPDAQPTTS